MITPSAAVRWSGSSQAKLAIILSLSRNGKFLNSSTERAVGLRFSHWTTEPCNLKSNDCCTKLNAKFVLLEIMPWSDTSLSLSHKLVACDTISTSNFTSHCCSIGVMLNTHCMCNRTKTLVAGKYQGCVAFEIAGSTVHLHQQQ